MGYTASTKRLSTAHEDPARQSPVSSGCRGAERYIIDLSEELVRRGHCVDVFTSRSTDYRSWCDTLSPHEHLDGVNVYRFRSLRRVAWTWSALRHGYDGWWRIPAGFDEPLIFVGHGPVGPGMFLGHLAACAQQHHLIHITTWTMWHAAIALLGGQMAQLADRDHAASLIAV